MAEAILFATMADDSMELSSEHGRNMDEDIDIDLNYGQPEEDYMVEDATSVHDFGDSFPPQQPEAAGYDDLMADDDYESYSMTDADALRDDEVLNTEPEPMSTEAEATHSGEVNAATHDASEVAASEANDALAKHSTPEQEVTLKNVDLTVTAEMSPTELSKVSTRPNTPRPPQEVQKTSPDISREGSPQISSPQHGLTPVRPQSPEPSLQAPGPVSPSSKSHEHELSPDPKMFSTSAESEVVAGGAQEGEEAVNTSYLDDDSTASICDVTVRYRDVEYALFSSSELDDPDSFFLSDHTIVDKPLSSFFEAIREVIHDDLADEDELCFTIDSLGLQTEEASSFLQDVTLNQILNIHEILLHNDGVDESTALYLSLETRTNFSKRLRNLSEAAAEGQSLSELITWNGGGDALEEAGEAEGDGTDPEIASEEHAILAAVSDNVVEGEHGEGQDPSIPIVHTGNAVLPTDSSHTHKLPPTSIQSPPQHHHALDMVSKDGTPFNPAPSSKQEYSASGEYDEDGDLIDYSEDEFELVKEQKHVEPIHKKLDNAKEHGSFSDACRKPAACNCSKCSALILQDAEDTNKRLDGGIGQGSPPHSVEETSHDQSQSAEPSHDDLAHADDNVDELDDFDEYAEDELEKVEGETEPAQLIGEESHEVALSEDYQGKSGDEPPEHTDPLIDQSSYQDDTEQVEEEESEHTNTQHDYSSYQRDTEHDGEQFGEEELEHAVTQHDEATYADETEQGAEEYAEQELEHSSAQNNGSAFQLEGEQTGEDFQNEELEHSIPENDDSTYNHDIEQYLHQELTHAYEKGSGLDDDEDYADHISQGQDQVQDHSLELGTNAVEFDSGAPIDMTAVDYHVDNLETGDGAESSATMSAEDLQYRTELDEEVFDGSTEYGTHALNEEPVTNGDSVQKDEIDYEDDEDEIAAINAPASENDPPTLSDSPNLHGKRSRAELESEDGPSIVNSKDAKRPRS